jgi:hypothetical protein
MSKNEFNKALINAQYNFRLVPCPQNMRDQLWNSFKNKDVQDLTNFLQTIHKFRNEFSTEQQAIEFTERVEKTRDKFLTMAREMLTTDEGIFVIDEVMQSADLKFDATNNLKEKAIEFFKFKDEEIKVKQTSKKETDENTCPDAITPEILEILHGFKR